VGNHITQPVAVPGKDNWKGYDALNYSKVPIYLHYKALFCSSYKLQPTVSRWKLN